MYGEEVPARARERERDRDLCDLIFELLNAVCGIKKLTLKSLALTAMAFPADDIVSSEREDTSGKRYCELI